MKDLAGSIAGVLTTAAFFPQVYRTILTGSAADFSWAWLVLMLTGIFTWIIYGVYLESLPMILANSVTLFSVAAIAWVKARKRPN